MLGRVQRCFECWMKHEFVAGDSESKLTKTTTTTTTNNNNLLSEARYGDVHFKINTSAVSINSVSIR